MIKNNLRKILAEKRLSQQELSEMTGTRIYEMKGGKLRREVIVRILPNGIKYFEQVEV